MIARAVIHTTLMKARRKELNMATKQLANVLGIHQCSVIKIENGKGLPSLPLALKIAQALQMPVHELWSIDAD